MFLKAPESFYPWFEKDMYEGFQYYIQIPSK